MRRASDKTIGVDASEAYSLTHSFIHSVNEYCHNTTTMVAVRNVSCGMNALTTTHSVGERSDMGALPPSAPVAPAADKLAFIYDDDD